ncbi:hypothetical protein K1719_046739 [Acacia pycnantha]|nr:hypothetical protein K1719_046739 [Acacia pycnantha]
MKEIIVKVPQESVEASWEEKAATLCAHLCHCLLSPVGSPRTTVSAFLVRSRLDVKRKRRRSDEQRCFSQQPCRF